ncbi:ribosome maturation protein [Zychaea mexicana]|uniref:ribosome maturation protein n=1 Tax=Zychaea mexicana TaxID=64656 RepID=UPI0022FE536A|nr:ribosome maturation protein [Zychaea mexicana]KAI9499302.1 ribosome maturation protein [Zychaea mexicana]
MSTKITYRGENDQEFFVIANKGMASKWRKDKTIPLVDVVQSFDVMTTSTGSETGEFVRPSKGTLESSFQTKNVDKVVEQIVEHGDEKNM